MTRWQEANRSYLRSQVNWDELENFSYGRPASTRSSTLLDRAKLLSPDKYGQRILWSAKWLSEGKS